MVGLTPERKSSAIPPIGGGGFNSYAAGNKHYGAGRNAPNVGITANKAGYGQRDASAANRKDALLRRAAGGNF